MIFWFEVLFDEENSYFPLEWNDVFFGIEFVYVVEVESGIVWFWIVEVVEVVVVVVFVAIVEEEEEDKNDDEEDDDNDVDDDVCNELWLFNEELDVEFKEDEWGIVVEVVEIVGVIEIVVEGIVDDDIDCDCDWEDVIVDVIGNEEEVVVVEVVVEDWSCSSPKILARAAA